MTKGNCLIVDDEPIAREILASYIVQDGRLTLMASTKSAEQASQELVRNPIDVMFLDISMPEMNGLEFLASLNNPPRVIFTTAHREYAVEGFELNATDYLLKPFSFDRFSSALDKVLATPFKRESVSPFLFVKSDGKLIKIDINDILYVEGLKEYIRIATTGPKKLIVYFTMTSFERKLTIPD